MADKQDSLAGVEPSISEPITSVERCKDTTYTVSDGDINTFPRDLDIQSGATGKTNIYESTAEFKNKNPNVPIGSATSIRSPYTLTNETNDDNHNVPIDTDTGENNTHEWKNDYNDANPNLTLHKSNGENDTFKSTIDTNGGYSNVPIDRANSETNTFESTNESIDDNSNLPIDRGWAWVILGAAIVQTFVIVGQMKCYGIFFVQLQKRFNTSSSLTSLVFTLQNIVYSVGALLIMNIGQSVSGRLMVVLGTVLSVAMLIITSLTENTVVLNLALGVGTGASYAMIQPTILAMLCTYFVKYRGLANSLYTGGVSLGGLVLAPFYTKLLDYYGYTGTYIMAAGMHAQLAVVGVLLRPLDFYAKTHKASRRDSKELCDLDETEKMIKPTNGVRRRTPLLSESESVRSTGSIISNIAVDSFLNSRTARYASSSILNTSLVDVSLAKSVNHQAKIPKTSEESKDGNTFRRLVVGVFLRIFDIELIKMPVFQYYFVCNMFLCAGSALIGANVPPHAFDCGIDDNKVALLVSINSVVDVLSKVIFGYIADKDCIRRSTLVAVCSLILGVVSQFFYFMNTFAVLMAFSIFIGFLQGVYFNLFAVILLDFLEYEKFKTAIGVICLAQGFSGAIAFPIAGALRDSTGRWHASYTFDGILLLIGGLMLLFLPAVVKRSNKKSTNQSRGDTLVT